jgi:hypothetical protein
MKSKAHSVAGPAFSRGVSRNDCADRLRSAAMGANLTGSLRSG